MPANTVLWWPTSSQPVEKNRAPRTVLPQPRLTSITYMPFDGQALFRSPPDITVAELGAGAPGPRSAKRSLKASSIEPSVSNRISPSSGSGNAMVAMLHGFPFCEPGKVLVHGNQPAPSQVRVPTVDCRG